MNWKWIPISDYKLLIAGYGLAENPSFEPFGEHLVLFNGIQVLAQLGVGVGVAVRQVHGVAIV